MAQDHNTLSSSSHNAFDTKVRIGNYFAKMSYHQWELSTTTPLSTDYIWSPLLDMMGPVTPQTRILDVGCGNGNITGRILELGCQVVGIDLSTTGIESARKLYPKGRFEVLAADENVLDKLAVPGFDFVVSTEVIEHLYDPKSFARGCFTATQPGGKCIVTTPYHGYLKNLAVAACGGFDKHVSPLWDGGHIKFWSRKTLGELLEQSGFRNLHFAGAGRYPFLWKSMLMSGDKPLA